MSTYLGYMLGGDLEVALLAIDHGPKAVATNITGGGGAMDHKDYRNARQAVFDRHYSFRN